MEQNTQIRKGSKELQNYVTRKGLWRKLHEDFWVVHLISFMKFVVSYKNTNFMLFVCLQIIGCGYRHDELGLNIEERRRWTLRSQWKSPCGESGWLKSSMKSWEIKRQFQNHLNELNDQVYLMLHSMIMKLQSGEDRTVRQKGEIVLNVYWCLNAAWIISWESNQGWKNDAQQQEDCPRNVFSVHSQKTYWGMTVLSHVTLLQVIHSKYYNMAELKYW